MWKFSCDFLFCKFSINYEQVLVGKRLCLDFFVSLIEPPHGKTNNLRRRKQRPRSASL